VGGDMESRDLLPNFPLYSEMSEKKASPVDSLKNGYLGSKHTSSSRRKALFLFTCGFKDIALRVQNH